MHPRSHKRELLQEDGASAKHERTFQRWWKSGYMAGLSSKKADKEMGGLMGVVLACKLLESKRSSGSCGREGLKAGVFSAHLNLEP